MEEWKYTNITKLAEQSFESPKETALTSELKSKFEDANFYNLFFVNGTVDAASLKSLSSVEGLTVLSLEDAFSSKSAEIMDLHKRLVTKYDRRCLY